MTATDPLHDLLRSFAHKMAGGYDTTAVLHDLCDQVAQIFGVTGAGVALVDSAGDLRFVTATVERVVEIERTQEKLQEGPCYAALDTGNPKVVSDIAGSEQWPRYRPHAERLGLRSVLGVPLSIGDQRIGALNIYDAERREWADEEVAASRVLADMAAAYVINATELEQSRRLATQLQEALDSRVVIEQAKGKLAGSEGISVDQAFNRLRRHARNNNASIRQVAQSVVELGLQLPDEEGN